MGCDIHVFIEYKVNDDQWKAHHKHVEDKNGHIRSVSATGRNYELFGELAGVRSSGGFANGLPEDVSDIIKQESDYWTSDGHSHSHMSLEKYEKILKQQNYEMTDRTDMFYDWENIDYIKSPPSFTTIVSGCKRHAEELQTDAILLDDNVPTIKHRLIFWFDN